MSLTHARGGGGPRSRGTGGRREALRATHPSGRRARAPGAGEFRRAVVPRLYDASTRPEPRSNEEPSPRRPRSASLFQVFVRQVPLVNRPRFNGVRAYSRSNGLSARRGLVGVSEAWRVGLHAARMGGPDRLHGMGGERPPQVVGSPCSPGVGTAMLHSCRPLRRPRRVGPRGISLTCPGAVRPALQVAMNLSRGGLRLGAPPP
jgi:hypothetical protein